MAKVIEAKVTGAVLGASSATVVANFILYLMAKYWDVQAASADPVIAFVNFFVAGAGAFLIGYMSRHTSTAEREIAADVEHDVVH